MKAKPEADRGDNAGEDTAGPGSPTVTQAMQAWKHNDYVLGGHQDRYLVKGDPTCGPVRTNDGFSRVNSRFLYNKIKRRMKLQLQGPIQGNPLHDEVCEALVNYDTRHNIGRIDCTSYH